jgi:hypothetical protein
MVMATAARLMARIDAIESFTLSKYRCSVYLIARYFYGLFFHIIIIISSIKRKS